MPDAIFDLNELIDNYTKFNYSIRAMWNGLYLAEIINENHIRFDESLKAGAEDYDFNLKYLRFVKKIGLTHYPLYKHFAREGQSASVGYNENRQKGIIKDYHIEVELFKKFDVSPATYVKQQLWYFYMLVREYCFSDTPLSQKQIIARLKLFRDEIDEYKKISPKEVIRLCKMMSKSMLKWELLQFGLIAPLFIHYKKKYN